MAELIKQANELPTIKLSLGLETSAAGAEPKIYLEASRGADVVGQMVLELAEVGLSPDFDPAVFRYGEPPFAFTEKVQSEVGRLVQTALGVSPILWLHLAPPIGNLATLPWETMFAPLVGERPIVRVPNFNLALPCYATPIDYVLCLSEPAAKEPFDGAHYLTSLVTSLLELSGPPPRIHLFTDAETYRELRDAQASWPGGDRVFLHDPADAAENPRGTKASRERLERTVRNHWLRWIAEEMREATADVVHFVTHGYIQRGQAALAVAKSPLENDDYYWARFIGTTELVAFLDQLGAWSVGFTSPPNNFSASGLRQVFDDVARLRAGPVLHHEAQRDHEARELGGAYAGLLRGEPPAFLPSISMYAHPELFGASPTAQPLSTDSFAEGVIVEAFGPSTEVPAEASAWALSTRRYLEQSVARMFPEEQAAPESRIQQAAGEGAAEALAFVNDVLSEQEGFQS